MPDFEEGRTEMVEDNQWPDMLIALTEVFANTPAALLLLQRFAWQRLPGGAPSYADLTAHWNCDRSCW
jgi:hypothetical protein